MYTIKNKIIYNFTWCMVFVMILIRINSSETSAILHDRCHMLFYTLLVVKVYDHVELEIELKL